jgi:polyribonucleotide nucleotidyltransferase
MATVCGASLAMMDAGVKLKAPVAGIAMGLVKEGPKYAILTDIAGAEDHYGDMDFKVAGTRERHQWPADGHQGARRQHGHHEGGAGAGHEARLHILDKMNEVISEGRDEMSPYAPRIYSLTIPTDKIREVIGPGGKVIRGIIEATGVKIDVHDDGTVNIFADRRRLGQAAIQMVTDITATAEVGKTYLGKVVRIADFGAFVEIFPAPTACCTSPRSRNRASTRCATS